MYKTVTTQEYKQHLRLPADYQVDGLLVMGSWDVAKYSGRVKSIVTDMYPGATVQPIRPEGLLSLGYEIIVAGRRVWFFVMYGGALLSEFADFACRFGSKKNVLVGLAGGLAPGAAIGDIIVPTASFKDGSSSTMYDPGHQTDVSADDELRALLKARLSQYRIHEGPTMTCQAALCESWEDIQKWSRDGYVGVEMETATLLAVSKHYDVPAAAVLSVGDNLIEEGTVLSQDFIDLAELRAKVRDDQFRAALAVLFAA